MTKFNARQKGIEENICKAARSNARFIKPIRHISEREDNGSEDGFVLQRRTSGPFEGMYDVYYTTPPRSNDNWQMGGIPTRQSALAQYLSRSLSKCTVDVSGLYRVCWDDMNFDPDATNCLVFSKFKDQQVALLPDLYQILDYKHAGLTEGEHRICLGVGDGITPFEKKKPMTVFAGK